MNLKGIVFDLDHTLFDRYKTLNALKNIIFDNLKEYISDKVTPEIFIDSLCDSDRKYVIYGWIRIFEDMCSKNIFSEIPDFKIYVHAIQQAFMTEAVPYPFTAAVLRHIKERGLKTGIVTNGSVGLQQAKIDMLGLQKHMDAIVISGEIGIHKPDAEPFLKAAELLGESPENLLYVGDHPKNDVDGSRSAGFTPVWVRTHGLWMNGIKKADYEIDTISAIPALVDSLL